MLSGIRMPEWLSDPWGSHALAEAIGPDENGQPRGSLADTELAKIIGSMPLDTLTACPGLGIDGNVGSAMAALPAETNYAEQSAP
jgi:hypothetical protein